MTTIKEARAAVEKRASEGGDIDKQAAAFIAGAHKFCDEHGLNKEAVVNIMIGNMEKAALDPSTEQALIGGGVGAGIGGLGGYLSSDENPLRNALIGALGGGAAGGGLGYFRGQAGEEAARAGGLEEELGGAQETIGGLEGQVGGLQGDLATSMGTSGDALARIKELLAGRRESHESEIGALRALKSQQG